MEKDWLFAIDNCICDVRTVGVFIRDNMILVQRERNGSEYALPGGHVKIGESLEQGLIREYKEETGADISCLRMLWSEECFWVWNGRKAHNFAFYYLIELCEASTISDVGDFVSHKDNCNIVFEWIPIDQIQNMTIYPEFLKREIYHLDGPMQHFVSMS